MLPSDKLELFDLFSHKIYYQLGRVVVKGEEFSPMKPNEAFLTWSFEVTWQIINLPLFHRTYGHQTKFTRWDHLVLLRYDYCTMYEWNEWI